MILQYLSNCHSILYNNILDKLITNPLFYYSKPQIYCYSKYPQKQTNYVK